jgi:hypothetical protein
VKFNHYFCTINSASDFQRYISGQMIFLAYFLRGFILLSNLHERSALSSTFSKELSDVATDAEACRMDSGGHFAAPAR